MPEADLDALSWPLGRLGEALEMLARRCRLGRDVTAAATLPAGFPLHDGEALGRWLAAATLHLGIEVEAAEIPYAGLDASLCRAAPALVRISLRGEPRFLALVGSRRGLLLVLRPDRLVQRVAAGTIAAAVRATLEAPLRRQIERLVEITELTGRDRDRAEQALREEALRAARIGGIWLLSAVPGASFWTQLGRAGCTTRLAGLALAHAVRYLIWIGSWWLIGRGALAGRLDPGWLVAWALLLATLIPFEAVATWLEGSLAIDLGGLLKRRLLFGVLRLEPEEVRYEGVGRLLGRTIEAEAVEALALNAGFAGLTAAIELVIALAVVAVGAGGWLAALLLSSWIALSIGLGRRYWRQRLEWTRARLEITHDLIERMVGHRTRLAQQPQARRHAGEDEALERYLEVSRRMDHEGAVLAALAPRGWVLVGVIGLAPAFLSGTTSTAQLAIGIGGILLAYQALRKLAAGLWHLAGAAIAWAQVAPLFNAAARPQAPGSLALASLSAENPARDTDSEPVIEAHHVLFGYRWRAEPAVQCTDLTIQAGDRILVEGSSGGGKSTLGALLAGLRLPQTGVILLRGLDRETLGSAAWRRQVALAPQFHENHVLTETFAFNLLMGRHWPPTAADLAEAEEICGELGLDELLRRMPAGLFQMVGETGWRLSHGERSRLYLARALLQRAAVTILDESLAALDPRNLRKAVDCAARRAGTLIVIAHP